MIRDVINPFLTTGWATFEVPGSADEGVRLLRKVVKSSIFPPITRQALVGRVTQDHVKVWRHRPLVHNSFVPVFSGEFLNENGRTILAGRFAMHWFTRFFMAVWLGGVFFFLVIALVTLPSASNPPSDNLLSIIGPLLMLIFGLGLVHLGRWCARGDIEFLEHAIRTALDNGGT